MTAPVLNLRPGDQLASSVCTARVVVVRVPDGGHPVLECGGRPMIAGAPGAKPSPAGPDAVTLIGKRYVNSTGSLEVLCTSSGTGTLTCDGAPMALKEAKPLPASD
jgi:hypothetical protein